MIHPNDLKKNNFTRAMRGYEPGEVNGYIDYVIGKYEELYNQCESYDKKLRLIASRIGDIQAEEDNIKKLSAAAERERAAELARAKERASAIITEAESRAGEIVKMAGEDAEEALAAVRRRADAQIAEAKDKSDALLLSTQKRCRELLEQFRAELNVQKDNILGIKKLAEDFNSALFVMYRTHINNLNASIPKIEPELGKYTKSELLDRLMAEIRDDAELIASSGSEADYSGELERLKPGNILREAAAASVLAPADTRTFEKAALKPAEPEEGLKIYERTQAEAKPASEPDLSGTAVFDPPAPRAPERPAEPKAPPEPEKPADPGFAELEEMFAPVKKKGFFGKLFGRDEAKEEEEADDDSDYFGLSGIGADDDEEVYSPEDDEAEEDDSGEDEETEENYDAIYEDK